MSGLNRVTLIGHLGQEPELTQAGETQICKFSVATSDGMKDRETGQPKTEWHRLIAFNKTAEAISKFFKKGSSIAIEGRIQYGKYDNKDGVTVYTTDVVVNSFVFLDKKEDNQQQSNNW